MISALHLLFRQNVLWLVLFSVTFVFSLFDVLSTPAIAVVANTEEVAAEPLPPGSVIEYHPQDQTVTVEVRAIPLEQLLGQLTEQTDVYFRLMPPAKEAAKLGVSRSFVRMPLEQAITQLVGRANTARIYSSHIDSSGRAQLLLVEVQILALGEQFEPIASSSSPTPRSSRPVVAKPQGPGPSRAPLPSRVMALPPDDAERAARKLQRRQQKLEAQQNPVPKSVKRRSQQNQRPR